MEKFYDLIIIGAGVAGLSALSVAPDSFRVALVAPGDPLTYGSSWRAQGGVAVALDAADSPREHALDTLQASRFLADPKAVAVLTEDGPARVRMLLASGLECDRDASGNPALGLEAAHSRARVLHRHDRTGRALVAHLWQQARSHPQLELWPRKVVRLLTGPHGIAGVHLDDGTVLATPRVILATGGFAGLYQATTTGRDVRGEGIVLAAQSGAQLADLEFVQFHPTALDDPHAGDGPLPLLTEALRGAGALLVNERGERFVDELSGRDEVARAIASQRSRGEVLLDLRPVAQLSDRFPEAASQLARFPERGGLLSVRPAAHYTIGGVVTDIDGATSVPGLYACGEVASSGVHGANRLASNSLLEGLVFGYRAGCAASTTVRAWERPHLEHQPTLASAEPEFLREFRARFERACGVVREAAELRGFLSWLERQRPCAEVSLAQMVASAALARPSSVGAHFRGDAVA